MQNITVGIAVGHIRPQIFDLSVSSIFLDVVVDPSEENILVAQSLHDIGGFVFLPQNGDFWEMFESDFAGDVDLLK